MGSQNCFGITLDWTDFNLVKQLTGDQLTTTSSALAETLWMSPMVKLWPTNVVTKQQTKFLCIVVAWEAIMQFPNCSLEPMQRRQTVMWEDIKINTNPSPEEVESLTMNMMLLYRPNLLSSSWKDWHHWPLDPKPHW